MMSMTLERALEEIVAIASFTPMQTEIETAGQMGRIIRVAEKALAAHRAEMPATATEGGREDKAPGLAVQRNAERAEPVDWWLMTADDGDTSADWVERGPHQPKPMPGFHSVALIPAADSAQGIGAGGDQGKVPRVSGLSAFTGSPEAQPRR